MRMTVDHGIRKFSDPGLTWSRIDMAEPHGSTGLSLMVRQAEPHGSCRLSLMVHVGLSLMVHVGLSLMVSHG